MANLTTCNGCLHFGRLPHNRRYVCRHPGGLTAPKPNAWCCYAVRRDRPGLRNKEVPGNA